MRRAATAGKKSGSSGSGKATGSSGSASGGSRSAVSAGVPYTAALLRSQGKSDVAITSALRQEGYTPAQIAKILNRRESTVRSDLRRGREQLKKILKEDYDFE